MITLYNVMDIRTGQIYSVAIVSQRMVRYFVPINDERSNEE